MWDKGQTLIYVNVFLPFKTIFFELFELSNVYSKQVSYVFLFLS